MPEISGHKIRQAIERLGLRRKAAATQFEKSIFQFDGEGEKSNPVQLAGGLERCELLMASLQNLQERFNQEQTITFDGENWSLAMAVKLVGGISRLAKQWKDAAEMDHGNEEYYFRRRGRGGASVQFSRDKERDYASRQIAVNQCVEQADLASSRVATLRAEIAEANAKTIAVPNGLVPLIEEFLPGLLN